MMDWGGRLIPFPAEDVERYRSLGLWRTLPLAAEFESVADRFADRVALITDEGDLTYRELDEQADLLALGLTELGLHPGDRVMLQVTNRLKTIIAWYGILKAGLIPVCTLAAHRAHEIGGISRRVDAVAHLVEAATPGFDLVAFAHEQRLDHPTLRHVLTMNAAAGTPGTRIEDLIASADATAARQAVARIQAAIDPDDIAVFQLSGGTTGIPKIIPRLHAEYWYNARSFAEASGWDGTTRVAHLLPVVHNAGITCGLHAAHSAGGALVLGTPVLDQAFPLLARAKTTDILLGHAHYGAVDHPWFDPAMSSMRRVVLSGAKLPPRVFEAYEQRGIWAGQMFGMGEGFFTLSTSRSTRETRLTTVGVPVSPYDEFRVLDPGTERDVPDGVVGELVCRGPYTLRGYFDAPEQNERAFTSDGYYRTGDLVAARDLGGERSISVEGRIKDLINRGGEKISAEEVEFLLLQHPGIASAAVVAMPDERLGERTCAYLVSIGEPLTMADVRGHLTALGVAKFKWPERLEWLPELPKTPVGKLDKKRLQTDIAAKIAAEPAVRA
jgi:2,3-dihydroxybenzoate-AMP ligase